MRIIKIILILFIIILFVSVIAGYIFLKTFDVNKYKPQIIKTVESSLKRPFAFSTMDLKISFKKGVRISIRDIVLGEDIAFGKDDFLSVEEIFLNVNVMAYLRTKEVAVTKITINRPRLKVIVAKNGIMNVQSLTDSAQQPSAPQEELPIVRVDTIDVEDATVYYVDQNFEPFLNLEFKQLSFGIKELSFDAPFSWQISAAFLNSKPNIFVSGQAVLNPLKQTVQVSDMKVETKLSSYSIKEMQSTLAFLKDVPWPVRMEGDVQILASSVLLGPAGLVGLDGDANLSHAEIILTELPVPLNNMNADISFDEKNIRLLQGKFSLGKGTISTEGRLEDYLTAQNYQLKGNLDSLSMNELINQKDLPVKIHGRIDGNFGLQGKGFDPVTMMDALKGQSHFKITEGKITDVNILKLVMEQIKIVPNMQQVLEEAMPPRFKEIIKKKDTIFTAVTADLKIENSTIIFTALNMDADGFDFKGTGQMTFDQRVDMQGSFSIPKEMSQNMVKSVEEFELLYNKDKIIQFPLKISGKAPAIKFMPDIKNVTANALKNKGEQELQKVLDKVIDKNAPFLKQEVLPSGAQGVGQEKQKTSEQILINSILDKVIKTK